MIQIENYKIRAQEVSKGCYRVQYTNGAPFSTVQSFALKNELYDLKETPILKSDKYHIDIIERSVQMSDEYEIFLKGEFYSGENTGIEFQLEEKIHFYGLGDKTGSLDKRGRKYMMWNTDVMTHTQTKDPL